MAGIRRGGFAGADRFDRQTDLHEMTISLRSLTGGLALLLALVSTPGMAQVTPSAPQSASSNDNHDQGGGWVSVPPGASGFIDVPAYASCRYVTNVGGLNQSVPIQSATAWYSLQSGINNSQQDPLMELSVCCRPPPSPGIPLCVGSAGGTVYEELPYTITGQNQTVTATCTDVWGETYTDSQTWSCGTIGSGVTADGKWSEAGGDSYVCSPNAHSDVSGCAGSCGIGSQNVTVYDSCGNVTSSYNQNCDTGVPCCVPNGSCSGACGGGAGTDNCGNSCVNNADCPVAQCTTHQYCCGDGYCYNDCGDGTQCNANNQGGCASGNCCIIDPSTGNCGGNTWTTSTSCTPCTSCVVYDTDPSTGQGEWVNAGPGCCQENSCQ